MANTTSIKKTKKAAKPLTFAQRTEQRIAQQNQWQQYNAIAKFYAGEIDRSLMELAEKTFPTDEFNSRAYQEAIVKALTETLSPEVGIKDFWGKMAEAGCKQLKIENGHLNFYKGKTKIDITPYTQAIIFEAHSSYYDQRMIERKERISEAKQQLEDLIKEISKKS